MDESWLYGMIVMCFKLRGFFCCYYCFVLWCLVCMYVCMGCALSVGFREIYICHRAILNHTHSVSYSAHTSSFKMPFKLSSSAPALTINHRCSSRRVKEPIEMCLQYGALAHKLHKLSAQSPKAWLMITAKSRFRKPLHG